MTSAERAQPPFVNPKAYILFHMSFFDQLLTSFVDEASLTIYFWIFFHAKHWDEKLQTIILKVSNILSTGFLSKAPWRNSCRRGTNCAHTQHTWGEPNNVLILITIYYAHVPVSWVGLYDEKPQICLSPLSAFASLSRLKVQCLNFLFVSRDKAFDWRIYREAFTESRRGFIKFSGAKYRLDFQLRLTRGLTGVNHNRTQRKICQASMLIFQSKATASISKHFGENNENIFFSFVHAPFFFNLDKVRPGIYILWALEAFDQNIPDFRKRVELVWIRVMGSRSSG